MSRRIGSWKVAAPVSEPGALATEWHGKRPRAKGASGKGKTSAVLSLRDAEREFCALGGTATPVRRAGETDYAHPALRKVLRVNARRKDAPRTLLSAINRLRRAREGQ